MVKFKSCEIKRAKKELDKAMWDLRKYYHIDGRRSILVKNVDIAEAKLRRLQK